MEHFPILPASPFILMKKYDIAQNIASKYKKTTDSAYQEKIRKATFAVMKMAVVKIGEASYLYA